VFIDTTVPTVETRTHTRISRITHKRLPCTCTFGTCGLITLSTFCLVLLSTDPGIECSTSQICSHTRCTLCVSPAKSPSLSAIHSSHSAISHTLTHCDTTVPHLTVRWLHMLLIHYLIPSLLFQLALDIRFSYLPVALMSEVTQVTTILGAVALCYNIFPKNMLYLGIAFSHHVYFQQPASLKTHQATCVMKIR